MIIHNCEQQSDEWFALRLGKITVSHFSDVLCKGAGRKQYMIRLLSERLTGERHPSFSNKAMQDGIEKEPEARAYYESLFGKVDQVGFIEVDEYLGCSPDGLKGEDGGIEIKDPYASTHISYILGERLPSTYKPQVQGIMWLANRKWLDFISYYPTMVCRPFWKIRVCRDEEYINNTLSPAVEVFIKEMKELEEKIKPKTMKF